MQSRLPNRCSPQIFPKESADQFRAHHRLLGNNEKPPQILRCAQDDSYICGSWRVICTRQLPFRQHLLRGLHPIVGGAERRHSWAGLGLFVQPVYLLRKAKSFWARGPSLLLFGEAPPVRCFPVFLPGRCLFSPASETLTFRLRDNRDKWQKNYV